jgi:hypothetical protein
MASVDVEYFLFEATALNVNQSITFFFTWFMFDEGRVVQFDATPDAVTAAGTGPFALQVVTDRTERDLRGGVRYIVVFRNVGNRALVFRPRVAVVPAGRFFGGGSS